MPTSRALHLAASIALAALCAIACDVTVSFLREGVDRQALQGAVAAWRSGADNAEDGTTWADDEDTDSAHSVEPVNLSVMHKRAS